MSESAVPEGARRPSTKFSSELLKALLVNSVHPIPLSATVTAVEFDGKTGMIEVFYEPMPGGTKIKRKA